MPEHLPPLPAPLSKLAAAEWFERYASAYEAAARDWNRKIDWEDRWCYGATRSGDNLPTPLQPPAASP